MTMDEKVCGDSMSLSSLRPSSLTPMQISLTGGSSSSTGCVGFLNAVERLQFPGMCFQDAGNGVRSTDFVSSWPSGLHVGASWNRNLALQRAIGMGGEFRTKGVNVLLGPVVGPLGESRSALSLPLQETCC